MSDQEKAERIKRFLASRCWEGNWQRTGNAERESPQGRRLEDLRRALIHVASVEERNILEVPNAPCVVVGPLDLARLEGPAHRVTSR